MVAPTPDRREARAEDNASNIPLTQMTSTSKLGSSEQVTLQQVVIEDIE